MRCLIKSGIIVLGAASLVQGQGDDAASHVGMMTVVDQISADHALSGTQRTAALSAANTIVAILRRDPALAKPGGYSVTLRLRAQRRRAGDPVGPDVYEVIYGSAKYFVDRGGQVEQGNAGFDFHIAVNGAGYASEIDDDERPADGGPRVMGADPANYAVYRETGVWRGRPVYGGDCTYLTHRASPPIVAVTTERYLSLRVAATKTTAARHDAQISAASTTPANDALKAFLRDRPQRDASNRKTLDLLKQSGASDEQIRQASDAFKRAEAQQETALRREAGGGSDQAVQKVMDRARAAKAEQVSGAQASLDGLSEGERNAPARVVEEGADDFRLARSGDDPDAIEPLMQLSSAFYDRGAAVDAPQLIWICAYHLQGLPDRSYDRLADGSASWREEKAWNERRVRDVGRIRDQLDWAALEALLRP
jgi:hypothetical protein